MITACSAIADGTHLAITTRCRRVLQLQTSILVSETPCNCNLFWKLVAVALRFRERLAICNLFVSRNLSNLRTPCKLQPLFASPLRCPCKLQPYLKVARLFVAGALQLQPLDSCFEGTLQLQPRLWIPLAIVTLFLCVAICNLCANPELQPLDSANPLQSATSLSAVPCNCNLFSISLCEPLAIATLFESCSPVCRRCLAIATTAFSFASFRPSVLPFARGNFSA